MHPRRAILLVYRFELRGSCRYSWPPPWRNVRGRRDRSRIRYPQLPADPRRSPRRIRPPPRWRSPPRRRRRPVGRRVEPHCSTRSYERGLRGRCLTKHGNPPSPPKSMTDVATGRTNPTRQMSASRRGLESVYRLSIILYISIRGYPALDLCDHPRIGGDCSNSAGEYVGVD